MTRIDSHPYSIPYLRTLRQRLLKRPLPPEAPKTAGKTDGFDLLRAREAALEQLPYALQGCYEAVLHLVMEQEALLQKLDAEGSLSVNAILIVQEAQRNSLALRLDSFIEVARRCQNASILYMSNALGISLPQSLDDVYSTILKGRSKLPQEVAELVKNYWDDSGKRLRAYRNLSQHYLLLASDVRAVRGSDHNAYLYLALPNNPEIESKSLKNLRFVDPTVHAIPYAIKAYQELYRYCFLLAVALMSEIGEVSIDPPAISLTPRTPFGAPGSEPIMWIEPLRVSSHCWRQREALELEISQLIEQRRAHQSQQPP